MVPAGPVPEAAPTEEGRGPSRPLGRVPGRQGLRKAKAERSWGENYRATCPKERARRASWAASHLPSPGPAPPTAPTQTPPPLPLKKHVRPGQGSSPTDRGMGLFTEGRIKFRSRQPREPKVLGPAEAASSPLPALCLCRRTCSRLKDFPGNINRGGLKSTSPYTFWVFFLRLHANKLCHFSWPVSSFWLCFSGSFNSRRLRSWEVTHKTCCVHNKAYSPGLPYTPPYPQGEHEHTHT